MLRVALGASGGHLRRAGARRAYALATSLLAASALAACGGGERQDADEPEGTFEVEVTRAEFPDDQKLAKRSKLVLAVRNADSKTIPNVAVTVKGFDRREQDEGLADPSRPTFVINGEPAQIGGLPESKELAPRGGETAYVGTWALGPLRPNEERVFSWDVTAVHPGRYEVSYEIAAGLDGKAKARLPGGRTPRGVFTGTIDDEPPDSRIAEDGRTVLRGD